MSSLSRVKNIIAVASGKGGVGKSTTAVNLSIALRAQKNRIGLLDADVYGPSIPMLMNLRGKPEVTEGKLLIPLVNYDIKCMSMGFLVDADSPMIWRGPMVMSAIEQMLHKVDWGDLDILVIDLPPGTGDAQLSICQRVRLSGSVIVCTPQDLALLDAVRGVNMFRKVNVPILGIVENMSHYICSHCGEVSYIFGRDGAKNTAKKINIDFLGEIPLHPLIRETSDSGKPITATDLKSPQSLVYSEIAKKILAKLHDQSFTQKQENPKITFD